jgi:3',5'-cyclic AMP phosphodiesterase CpdA
MLGCLAVVGLGANHGRLSAAPLTLTLGTGSSANDAVEYLLDSPGDSASKGQIDLVNDDYYLGKDSVPMETGLRFEGVSIPKGAVITSARIQFTCSKVVAAPPDNTVVFYAQDADNAAAFSITPFDLTSRSKTTLSATWSIPSWPAKDAMDDPNALSADLKSLVQAVVDRPGWNAGQAMVFLVEGTAQSAKNRKFWTADSLDPQRAPRLIVTYDAPTTMTVGTASGSDDATEFLATSGEGTAGTVVVNDDDHYLGYDSTQMEVGLRFAGLSIPKGSIVTAARIQFTCSKTVSTPADNTVAISAQDADDAAPFVADPFNISARAKTGASVTWAIPAWAKDTMNDPNALTPDLKPLVQLVVNRAEWNPGQAMAFLINGTAQSFKNRKFWTADNMQGAGTTFDPQRAPRLTVSYLEPLTLTLRTVASSDDATEFRGDSAEGIIGKMVVADDDHYLGYDSTQMEVGLRFAGLTVPPNSTITSARIQFTCSKTVAGNNTVTLCAQDADSADAFGTSDFDISARTKTNASVTWAIPDWAKDTMDDPNARTPDLKSLVQAVVSRPGWSNGQALAFLIDGMAQSTKSRKFWTADSLDPQRAPRLIVTYLPYKIATDEPSNDKYRLTWNDDPATTMVVGWDQLRGTDPVVRYGTEDQSRNADAYPLQQVPTRVERYHGMNNHFAKMTGLTPDTAYYFVIRDSDTVSERFWFRTAPATPKAFSFITGGDTGTVGDELQAGRYSNQLVPKLRPLFVLFTGDLTSSGNDDTEWKTWLDDWSRLTRTPDGRLFPFLSAHGNHEDADKPVLSHLFDLPVQGGNPDNLYYGLSFGGNLLRVTVLDSMVDPAGAQRDWLAAEVAGHGNFTFKAAAYHKPFAPHTTEKPENTGQYDQWAGLFKDYGLSLAMEGDSHCYKVTFPLSPSMAAGNYEGFVRNDAGGTIFLGEGGWGSAYRPNDDDKPWTLNSGSYQNASWVQVLPAEGANAARLEIRTFQTGIKEGTTSTTTTSTVPAMGSNTEDTPFAVPANAPIVNVPFYGTVVTYPFQAVSGSAPAAPSDLAGAADSYTSAKLHWTNHADPALTKALLLERQSAGSADWQVVSRNIPSDATQYTQTELQDDAQYTYRIAAHNIFGQSAYSNSVVIDTPKDPVSKSQFQQGLIGYSGAVDLEIWENQPDAVRNTGLSISPDHNGDGDKQQQMLMRFKDLFGNAATQVPPGARIVSAALRTKSLDNTVNHISLHRMLVDWPADATWNSMNGGVTTDGVEAAAGADASYLGLVPGPYYSWDVTATVLEWQQNPASNFGWVFVDDGSDGWDTPTSRALLQETRPMLTVYYSIPTVPASFPMGAWLNQSNRVAVADVLAACGSTDPGGLPLRLTAVGSNSSLGGTVAIGGGFINYTPPAGRYGMDDTFTYTVTDANGASIQGTVTVRITSPTGSGPNVAVIAVDATSATVRMAGTPDQLYQVEASTDLADWVNLGWAKAAANGLVEFTDFEKATHPRRFYRIGQGQLPSAKIAVFSDPHYMAPSLVIADGTAFQTYLAQDRKMLAESAAILDSVVTSISAQTPDIVLVPGDLTKDGELVSHQGMVTYLQRLKDAGAKVFVCPGNHDVNNPHALSFNGAATAPVATVQAADFASIYGAFGYNDAIARDPASLAYVAEPVPGLWILAMDACHYELNTGGAPYTAGYFDAARLAWITSQLAAARDQGKFVIGMVHHGSMEHYAGQKTLFSEYVLDNYQDIDQLFASYGMKVVFTGHYHAQDVAGTTLPAGSLFDIETGSTVTYPCPYRIMNLDSGGVLTVNSYRITNINYNLGGQDFQTYAASFLQTGLMGISTYMLMSPPYNVPAPQAQSLAPAMTEAFMSHYQGDETSRPISLQTQGTIQYLSTSTDPLFQFMGYELNAIFNDPAPADNNLTIDLITGSANP